MSKRENGFYWADVSDRFGSKREIVEFSDGDFLVIGEYGKYHSCEISNVSNERVTESKLCKGNCKCKKQ